MSQIFTDTKQLKTLKGSVIPQSPFLQLVVINNTIKILEKKDEDLFRRLVDAIKYNEQSLSHILALELAFIRRLKLKLQKTALSYQSHQPITSLREKPTWR